MQYKLPIGIFVGGFILTLLAAIVGWVVFPNIVEKSIKEQVQLKEGSETFDKWSDITLPIHLKFYVFNVTNPDEVEVNLAKPILQELGPYVYEEKRIKEDIRHYPEEGRISYRQPITYFFKQDLSNGSEDDLVNFINVPFVGLAQRLDKVITSRMFRTLVNMYIARFKERLFVRKSIGEILFKGYHQPFIAQIQNMTGKKILENETFGLFYPSVIYGLADTLGGLPLPPDIIIGLVNGISNTLVAKGEKIIRKDTRVGELIFDGFDVTTYTDLPIGPLLPAEFEGGLFGIYRGNNGSDDGNYTIDSGTQGHENFGNVITWNGKTKLDFWYGEYCNMINGSDGSIYPPFVKKDRVLYIFNVDLCRSLYLTYKHEMELMDIPGYRFVPPFSMLEDPNINRDNMCFCDEVKNDGGERCHGGAIPLDVCRDGAPIVMSTPHFLDGDAGNLAAVIGLNPNRDKHETFIDLEPNSGLVLQASKRIQINVQLKPLKGIDALENAPRMLFPLMWADEFASLDDETADDIRAKLITTVNTINIIKWVVLAIGLVLVGLGAGIFYRQRRKSKAFV